MYTTIELLQQAIAKKDQELRQVNGQIQLLEMQLQQAQKNLAEPVRQSSSPPENRDEQLLQQKHHHQLLAEKLYTSEQKLRAIFAGMKDLVLLINTAGNIELLPTNTTALSNPDCDMIGLTIQNFFQDDNSENWWLPIRQALETQQPINFDYKLSIGDREVWFTACISPMSSNSVLWVARDISDRLQVELALQEAKAAADKANQAKSEFLSNMSHELRTPLNAILGFTQLLIRDESLNQEQQKYLRIISRSGEHLLNLINSILQLSKIEVGQVKFEENTFNLYHLLNSLEAMLQLQAKEKGLQLRIEREQDVPQYVQTDENKLRQVLINLLGNALKFTAEGGVTLRVKSQGLGVKENCLFFEVEDTGLGIAPEEIDNLFQVYGQTETGRRSQQGTGLGLSISRQLVQLLGGNISVSSQQGKGSLFQFDIRVELADQMKIQAVKPSRQVIGLAPGQPEYRILVVDDSWESRILLVNLLASVGFAVQEAENGSQAVKQWSTWEPHLIWMDMQMSVMDGYEATKRIRSSLKGQATVIIALTASAFEENRSQILAVGCDDFVSKPFRETVVFEKMAQYLGVHYLYEESPKSQTMLAVGQKSVSGTSLELTCLQVMPPDWVELLYQAAIAVDNEQIFKLLEQIPDDQATLCQAIADWVNSFRCDKIVDLIEELRNS